MLTMENPSPTLETCGDLNGDDYRKNYSKSFQKFVEKCLLRDPDKRYSKLIHTLYSMFGLYLHVSVRIYCMYNFVNVYHSN